MTNFPAPLFKRLRLVVAALLLALLLLVLFCWYWLYQPLAAAHSGSTLVVEPGDTVYSIAADLQQQGVMPWSVLWRVYARFIDTAPIKAGEYAWPHQASPKNLLDLLQSGAVIQYRVTLVEGGSYREFIRVLQQQPKLKAVIVDSTPSGVSAQLDMNGQHPEGWFYPDTYQYVSGETDLSILRRALTKMQLVLNEQWQMRADGLPYAAPYEALTMASIIEKETGAPEEREQIAGVFVRRLQKNMRLQTDPTVIYGLGDQYTGNLTRTHLRTHTAYNTYRVHGLPPTPIANPGVAAIHAALNPAPGEALYFVAKGDGSHVFSATLEEHNRAVEQYQRRARAQNYRSAPGPSP